MKVRSSVKPICPNCRQLRRRNGKGKWVVRYKCETPKHNQRQG